MQQLGPVWGPEIDYEVIYSHKRQNIATKIGIKLTSICQFQIWRVDENIAVLGELSSDIHETVI